MTSPSRDQPPRLTEDARDTAVRRVQEAYAGGHISHDKMDEHLHQVLAATRHSELDPVLASLPEDEAAKAEGPAGAEGKVDTASTIAAVSGRIKRGGAWRVPRFLRVESAFGRVHLDLSRALLDQPVVDIELRLGTGRAKITVPRGATVELEGLRTVWKDTHYKSPRRPVPGGPTIRILGTMGYGRLRVRHARR
ncbi:DUF1707 SHOCT-like domain-containing protein [Streptomyces tsukubensis]|uniref:DUF1707 domain-containing protein n=1 Tax=Streptomyces tsukubensis TaxID=83656 RepID=A0A1V4A4P9_9ACTN|nr:DUF1707 domain-containing protein [Streptomyces tsukubensis]OON74950.1 hypothetical protein B1H18_24380 [Streptomyces tsukubensis]QFR94735.1 DUF1707 domain-containing protein [Streptomyces tsukubensis]